jgi:hypothetical protein
LRYQIQLNFSPLLYWTNEADNRRFIHPDVETQLIFHSLLHFRKNAWDFCGGLTLSYGFASRPEIGYKNVTTEIRPIAEVSHEIPLRGFSIQNRIRVDNRFIEANENESIFKESRHLTRYRYRLQFRIPVKNSEDQTKIVFRLAEEIMINGRENYFDQNRVSGAAEFIINKKFSVESGYIYIYQQRFGTEDIYKRHILRFSVLHRINTRKS